jgi:predicted trehalose synthase
MPSASDPVEKARTAAQRGDTVLALHTRLADPSDDEALSRMLNDVCAEGWTIVGASVTTLAGQGMANVSLDGKKLAVQTLPVGFYVFTRSA